VDAQEIGGVPRLADPPWDAKAGGSPWPGAGSSTHPGSTPPAAPFDAVRRRAHCALRPVHEWVGGFERFWNESFDRLDTYVQDLKQTRQEE
jgi:hypothetical protein